MVKKMMSRSDKGKPFSQKCRRRCGFTKLKGQQEELSSLMIKRIGGGIFSASTALFFHHLIE